MILITVFNRMPQLSSNSIAQFRKRLIPNTYPNSRSIISDITSMHDAQIKLEMLSQQASAQKVWMLGIELGTPGIELGNPRIELGNPGIEFRTSK